jgi:hypothetical protein
MYAESVTAGMPMTALEVGEAFGRSERWGRERMNEVRSELADLAGTAEIADADQAAAEQADGTPTFDKDEATEVPAAEEAEVSTSEVVPRVEAATGDRTPRSEVLAQHRRIRWGVRATLVLGVVASTVANVLHAEDNPISQTIAAWPPLALLATIELISRVPVHRRSLALVRFSTTAVIAGIAAWVSYGHMADVIRRYGETGASPYLIPLTVDGLVVVASVCLVELGSRIRALSAEVGK